MRTIRFRAKRIDNGEWVFGGYSYCEKDNTHYITVMGKDHISHIGFHQQVNPETIGQFTGFYDKNGKEICKGDIVKFLDSEYEVIFEMGTFGLGTHIEIDYDKIEKEVEQTTDNDYSGVRCDNFIALWTIYWNFNCEDDVISQIEIIGNIYENKENI